MLKLTKKEIQLTPKEVRTLLRRASTPKHPDFRAIWNPLYETTYKKLQQQLSYKFSNICFEDIEELVSDAFIAFQIQFVRKNTYFQFHENALSRRQKFERIRKLKRFIRLLQEKNYIKYLFNLCNWMALDFLSTGRRQAINIVTIDAILSLANENELYENFEAVDFQTQSQPPVWLEKIETLLGPKLYPVFRDFVVKGWSHEEIAEEHGISEESSRERKSRAVRKLQASHLIRQLKQYASFKSVSIFFIIILF